MKNAKRSRRSVGGSSFGNVIEPLESRLLLSAAPRIIAKGVTTPYQTTEGTPLSGITVATFTDASGDPLTDFSASITWGDAKTTPGGNTSAGVITTDGAGDFTVTGSHTYVVPAAARVIGVKIVDSDGGTKAAATSHAKVADAPITASPVAVSGVKNSPIVAATATFTDADPNATLGPPSTDVATINWGDGTSSAGTLTQDPNTKVFTVVGKHTYLVSKSYTVTTTIHDRTGTSKTTATSTATIVNPYPVTSPSMVNDYSGTVKLKILGVTTSHSFDIDITDQTLTSITGSIEFDGATIVNGTLDAGVISGVTDGELSNGNFIFVYNGSTIVTLSGHLSSDGKTITNGLVVASNTGIPGFGTIHGNFTATVN